LSLVVEFEPQPFGGTESSAALGAGLQLVDVDGRP